MVRFQVKDPATGLIAEAGFAESTPTRYIKKALSQLFEMQHGPTPGLELSKIAKN